MPEIESMADLLAWAGADTVAGLPRRLYKDTGCGASISLLVRGYGWVHTGDSRLLDLTPEDMLVGFTIQTIVEGSDATVDSDPFLLPVQTSDVDAWVQTMERRAADLWEEANPDGS